MNRPPADKPPSGPAKPPSGGSGDRLVSLDAYRGFTMLAMVSAGMGLAHLRGDAQWGWLADQFEHRTWEGCTFWDLIQPSFMFIVGVAMPLSFAVRQSRGETWLWQFMHAVKRAVLLVALGVYLDSYAQGTLFVQFIRVLQQIALGYLVAFVVLHLGPKVQAATAVFLLVGHTAAFLLYGNAMGIAPWTAGNNVGVYLDNYFRLPLSQGNYVTFNFVSSAATILIGVLAGELLRGPIQPRQKTQILLLAGIGCLAVGWLLSGGNGWVPVSFPTAIPMIKRLWTASFAVYAAGWTFVMLALFYMIIEVLSFRVWAFLFVVVGMNSIAMYMLASLFRPWMVRSIGLFVDDAQGTYPPYKPVLIAGLVLLGFWLICLWLYLKRIFFKV
ncbi:MAG: DUF5009 domain-containing protein [Gemmataceae bacterium]|nr:DUF5009 domain-containing protein [Gemmataceae bacterium]